MSLINFLNLVANEIVKTYIRLSTWIMYIILAVIIIGFGMLNNSIIDYDDSHYSEDNWRELLAAENEKLIEENEIYTEEMEGDFEEDEIENIEFVIGPDMDIVDENNYYLKNDIQPTRYGAGHFVAENAGLLSVVSLFTIIIAAGIIASEFRWGTIKLLLIRPYSRTKILFSKYVAVLLFALFTLLFVIILSWITGAVLFGVEGSNANMLLYSYTDDLAPYNFRLVSVLHEVMTSYGYGLVNLVMMTTFAFMVSTVFRNSSLAIGTAIFLMMGGNSIVSIFAEKPFAKYILFANTNLKQYADGDVFIDGMTLNFSITMLIIYYLIFVGLSWIFFTKRDVV